MTEHNRLFFMESSRLSPIAFPRAASSALDFALYVDSKFLCHEVATKQDLNALAKEVVVKRCIMDRQSRFNMLTIARTEPSRLATFFDDPALITYQAKFCM